MAQSSALVRIDVASPVPVYRQIADGIRALLMSGELQVGDVLPPVRELGLELGVHHNTVAEAYRQLAGEGWLELARRRGASVRARPTPRHPARGARERFAQRARELLAAAWAEGLSREELREELQSLLKTL